MQGKKIQFQLFISHQQHIFEHFLNVSEHILVLGGLKLSQYQILKL